MRPLLALLVAGSILGGLQLYMQFRPQPKRVVHDVEQSAAGRFTVEITLTFDAGPDAFALDPSSAPAVLLQLRGTDVVRRTDSIAAGEQVRADHVQGIVTGKNEFFVQATPQDGVAAVARAVRVRILRDGNPVADETLWAEPGEVVQGAVMVDVPAWVGAPSAANRAARRGDRSPRRLVAGERSDV